MENIQPGFIQRIQAHIHEQTPLKFTNQHLIFSNLIESVLYISLLTKLTFAADNISKLIVILTLYNTLY